MITTQREKVIFVFTKTLDFEVEKFCKDLGLKGRQILSIKSVIKTESDLFHFKKYIIEQDDSFKSNLELVYNYVNSVDLSKRYDFESFLKDFKVDKVLALKSISKGFYSNSVLEKVEKLLKDGLTLNELYTKVVNGDGNIRHTITLLSSTE